MGENVRVGLELSSSGRVLLWRELTDGVVSIGRNPEADLCVPDASVAPVHVLLRREGAVITLINRTSAPIQVGDEVVTDELRLADGDQFTIGTVVATLRFERTQSMASKGRTLTLEAHKPAEARGVFLISPETLPNERFAIDARGLTLGADETNDIVLKDPYVSAFHARVTLENGRVFVRDLGSRNGVFVQERKLIAGEVPTGAQLRLGQVVFLVSEGESEPTKSKDVATRALVGKSRVMSALRESVRRMAATEAPVLVTGETGTGKEVVARLLAALSKRHAGPFVALNCGALTKSLIESELFGHEKGAFTGASAKKAGAFEAAHGGTLFLDEIGELPLELQPQLLRVLETGEVRRVGATDTFRVNVRVIAATHRRLAEAVAAGTFREDLFFRLHVLMLELPALRERPEDIEELARHFVHELAPKGELVRLSGDALAKLRAHVWPGNVRELRNVIQRAVLLRRSNELSADDITFTPSTLETRVETAQATSNKTLFELERDAIVKELTRHRGNKTEAASALGVSRSTIHRKIAEYAIDVDALVQK